MANHRRSSSIPQVRLSQPLPPLPSGEIRLQDLPQITIQIPYHDDPAEDEGSPTAPTSPQPPGYEPMYDYLRSQQRPANLPPPLSAHTIRIITTPPPEEPYRDEPFVITIDPSQPPPPSYEELYIPDQRRRELEGLVQEFDINSNPAEEICKFIVAMLLIALTIACVGTAFNWGRPWCEGAFRKC